MLIVTADAQPREEWRPGVETRMLVSALTGAKQLCIFEQWVAPAKGPRTHSHPVEEVLTILAGETDMWIDDQHATLTAGQSLYPRAQKARFSKYRYRPFAYTCRAVLADFRNVGRRRGRAGAALAGRLGIEPRLTESKVRQPNMWNGCASLILLAFSPC